MWIPYLLDSDEAKTGRVSLTFTTQRFVSLSGVSRMEDLPITVTANGTSDPTDANMSEQLVGLDLELGKRKNAPGKNRRLISVLQE